MRVFDVFTEWLTTRCPRCNSWIGVRRATIKHLGRFYCSHCGDWFGDIANGKG